MIKYKLSDMGDKLLPYAKDCADNFRALAFVEMAMEYYLLMETVVEGGINLSEDDEEILDFIGRNVDSVFLEGKLCNSISEIADTRDVICKKMQVATAYVDRLMIYEYVANRMEARFKYSDDERRGRMALLNKDSLARTLVNYIFTDEDQMGIADRLSDVLGQIPVRMGRKKFFEYVVNSIKLYSESDENALNGYLYMLRTVSMLYTPEGIDEYYPDLIDQYKELRSYDLDNMTADLFTLMVEKTGRLISRTTEISDVLMLFEKMINMLYVMAATEGISDDLQYADDIEKAKDVYKAIYENEDIGLDSEEVLSAMSSLEGIPERLYERRISLEGLFNDIEIAYTGLIKEQNLTNEFENIGLCQKLFSSSLFAELEDKEPDAVTPEKIAEVSEELIKDLTEAFANNYKAVNRAIMSGILSNLPTFFSTAQEIYDYITASLDKCSDEAELIAVWELFGEILAVD